MFRPLKTLTQAAGAVVLVSLSGCSSLGSSLLPGGLVDALGSVTGLSSSVSEFAGSLGSAGLDAAGLGQLEGFVGQAGDLGKTIGGFKDQVAAAAANPLGAIGDQLGQMGNFDVSALQGMPGAEQLSAVNGFADQASGVGSAASDFLKQFGG